jgi:hypothetical protein
MPVLETVFLYVVVPLVAVLLLAAVTMLPGRGKGPAKYKPGQPWEHEAVWYEPHPDIPGLPVHGDRHDDHGLAAHDAVGGQTSDRALAGRCRRDRCRAGARRAPAHPRGRRTAAHRRRRRARDLVTR